MSMDDFQVLGSCGEGSFASVWKVKRRSDGQTYAIKKVNTSKMNRKEIRDTLNEIRFLASIRHPRIVGFYEVFQMQEDHAICMVLEFCAHGDLAQEVDKHRKAKTWFPEPRLWRYLAQVLEALKVLHERGIVHRDVKAANCFLGEGDTVKLGDMNISKRIKDGALLQTQTGTPYYMSPEIWANQPYGPPSDIWSLGVLLYELCALRKPFTASSFPELRRKVTAGAFPPLKAQRYSADLARALALLLRTAADQRPEAWELLDSSLVQSNLKMGESDQEEFEVGEAVELLQTIKIPRTFEELADRLPKACYPDLRPNSPDKWPAMDRARSLSPGPRPRHGPGYDPPDSRAAAAAGKERRSEDNAAAGAAAGAGAATRRGGGTSGGGGGGGREAKEGSTVSGQRRGRYRAAEMDDGRESVDSSRGKGGGGGAPHPPAAVKVAAAGAGRGGPLSSLSPRQPSQSSLSNGGSGSPSPRRGRGPSPRGGGGGRQAGGRPGGGGGNNPKHSPTPRARNTSSYTEQGEYEYDREAYEGARMFPLSRRSPKTSGASAGGGGMPKLCEEEEQGECEYDQEAYEGARMFPLGRRSTKTSGASAGGGGMPKLCEEEEQGEYEYDREAYEGARMFPLGRRSPKTSGASAGGGGMPKLEEKGVGGGGGGARIYSGFGAGDSMFETYDEENFKPSSSRAAGGGGQAMPKFVSPRLDSGAKYGSKQATPLRQLRNDRAVSENDWEPKHIRPLPERHQPGGGGLRDAPCARALRLRAGRERAGLCCPRPKPTQKRPRGHAHCGSWERGAHGGRAQEHHARARREWRGPAAPRRRGAQLGRRPRSPGQPRRRRRWRRWRRRRRRRRGAEWHALLAVSPPGLQPGVAPLGAQLRQEDAVPRGVHVREEHLAERGGGGRGGRRRRRPGPGGAHLRVGGGAGAGAGGREPARAVAPGADALRPAGVPGGRGCEASGRPGPSFTVATWAATRWCWAAGTRRGALALHLGRRQRVPRGFGGAAHGQMTMGDDLDEKMACLLLALDCSDDCLLLLVCVRKLNAFVILCSTHIM